MTRLFLSLVLLSVVTGCGGGGRDGSSSDEGDPQVASKSDPESAIQVGFGQPSYSFTLAEVAKGVTIRYRVNVLHELDGMHPQSQLSVAKLNETGLLPFAWIQGNEQQYRPWDFGLGLPHPGPVTISKGSRVYRIEWDGRNWQGPSDTDMPTGPPFPPGRYTITVRIVGHQDTPSGKKPYEVKKTVPLILTR